MRRKRWNRPHPAKVSQTGKKFYRWSNPTQSNVVETYDDWTDSLTSPRLGWRRDLKRHLEAMGGNPND